MPEQHIAPGVRRLERWIDLAAASRSSPAGPSDTALNLPLLVYNNIVAAPAGEAVRLPRRSCHGGIARIPGVCRCP